MIDIAPIIEAIEAKDPTNAASLAIQHQPTELVESFDYHRIADDAEPYFEFVKAWVAAAHPLEKPTIARWFVDNSVADFAYLDAQAEGASLLSSSVREAKDHLAKLIDDLNFLSQGPDSGLAKARVAEYKQAATQLREIVIP